MNKLLMKIVALLLVVPLFVGCTTQTPPTKPFDKSYGTSGKDGLRNIRALKDGGYIAVGWIGQTTKNHVGKGYLIKVDADGNLIWQKTLSTNESNRITNVFEGEDGTLLIVVEEFPTETEAGQVVLMNLTPEGEVISKNAFGGTGPDIIEIMRETPDGGYAFVGAGATTAHGNYQAWIGKLSADYKLEWQHHLGGAGKDRLTDCRVLSDGSIIGVGYLMEQNQDSVFVDKPWLLKLDSKGKTIWSHHPEFIGAGALRGIALGQNGNIALVGYVKNTESGGTDPWLGVASDQGLLVWDKVIPMAGYNNLMAVEQLPDGSYLGIGSTKNPKTEYDAFLVSFSNIEQLDTTSVEKPGRQFGRVVYPTEEASILIGGFHQTEEEGDQLWLYKNGLFEVFRAKNTGAAEGH